MSWSYSGNPVDSPTDDLRFTLGDTNVNEPVMQDEELQYLIATYGASRSLLLYQAFIRMATLFARDTKRRLGTQQEDPTERMNFFKEQANFYRKKMSVSGLSVPSYAYPKIFRKGMQSNPPYPRTDADADEVTGVIVGSDSSLIGGDGYLV